MKTEKRNISVDHERLNVEKNIDWEDYPCVDIQTETRMKHNLGCYFESWEDYIKNGGKVFPAL